MSSGSSMTSCILKAPSTLVSLISVGDRGGSLLEGALSLARLVGSSSFGFICPCRKGNCALGLTSQFPLPPNAYLLDGLSSSCIRCLSTVIERRPLACNIISNGPILYDRHNSYN